MSQTKRSQRIRHKIFEAKEELLNRIAASFNVNVPIKLAPQESIFLGAQGCFEGDQIKINRTLPLFWQLIILEHEMGHYLSTNGKQRSGIIFQRFQTHPLSTNERRAWDWVEENPIMPGGTIDRQVKMYLKDLNSIAKMYGHVDEVMRMGWWY